MNQTCSSQYIHEVCGSTLRHLVRYDTARPGFAGSLWRDDRARNKATGFFCFQAVYRLGGASDLVDEVVCIPSDIAGFIDIAG